MRPPQGLMYCGWDAAFKPWVRARVLLLFAARQQWQSWHQHRDRHHYGHQHRDTIMPAALLPSPPIPWEWLLQKPCLWVIPGRCGLFQKLSCASYAVWNVSSFVRCLLSHRRTQLRKPVLSTATFTSQFSWWKETHQFERMFPVNSCCLGIKKQHWCHLPTKPLSAASWFPGDRRLETTPSSQTQQHGTDLCLFAQWSLC